MKDKVNYPPQFKENAINEMINRSKYNSIAEFIYHNGKNEFIRQRNEFYNNYFQELKSNNNAPTMYQIQSKVEEGLRIAISKMKENSTRLLKDYLKDSGFQSSYMTIVISCKFIENKGTRNNNNWVVNEEDVSVILKKVRSIYKNKYSKCGKAKKMQSEKLQLSSEI